MAWIGERPTQRIAGSVRRFIANTIVTKLS